jgi:hypothetical protein
MLATPSEPQQKGHRTAFGAAFGQPGRFTEIQRSRVQLLVADFGKFSIVARLQIKGRSFHKRPGPYGERHERNIATAALAASALLPGAALAQAQQSGTAAEARAMLDAAVAALEANEASAIAAFNDKANKQFHDRDLYVFCNDMTIGTFTAHPNPALMGTDIRALKVKDDPLGQRIFDTITKAPAGTVATVD